MSTPPGGLSPHAARDFAATFRMGHWVTDGNCTEDTAERFFVDKTGNPEPAKNMCRTCPVIQRCAEYALNHPTYVYGIWGGLTEEERDVLRKKKGIRTIPTATSICGTAAGYKRHIRLGVVPCADCRRAEARKRQERRAAK